MKFLVSIFIAIYLSLFSPIAYANSSYVLPYPSVMPGSIFYNLNLVKENVLKYWHFGDFAQFHFNLQMSDKYLVEAKTLFDYRQYLLGFRGLEKSDDYFNSIKQNLTKAKKNGKNINEKEELLKSASKKHTEELLDLKKSVPNTFEWTPEKGDPTTLYLLDKINNSIIYREKVL